MDALTAEQCRLVIGAMAQTIEAQKSVLSDLDARLGDGDHGHNMAAALQASVRAIAEQPNATPAELFKLTGNALMNSMGGASGIIFGSFFIGGSRVIQEQTTLTLVDVNRLFAAGIAMVQKRGKAQPGDKTMLDALLPAAAALQAATEAARPLTEALATMAAAAQQGAATTSTFVARHGRARFLGERSLGIEDAGAASIALMLTAWAECVGEHDPH